jgi:membrane protease YdiL (CAAX protease family)
MPPESPPASDRSNQSPNPPHSEAPPVPLRCNRIYLAVELLLLFVLGPLLLFVYRRSIGVFLIPALLAVAGFCMLLLLRDPAFDRGSLVRTGGFHRWLKQLPVTVLPGTAALAAGCAVFRPDLLFSFASERTLIWLLVIVLYPLLSAVPQEIIFRTFFFHRYQRLFPNDICMMLTNGVCFGLAHLFFGNWLAPALTAAGGVIFARTYSRTGSTLLVCLEHSLWGNFIFTIGLGWYFYTGSITV